MNLSAELEVAASRQEIIERLDTAARRGRLAGFRPGEVSSAILFEVTEFGSPFESVLRARAHPSGGLTRLSFSVNLKPAGPWALTLGLLLSVWPGVWLTDSLIRTYFSSYDVRTWIWYLPLTVPFCPWVMWSTLAKSRASARAEIQERILPRIASALDAKTASAGTTTSAA